MTREPFGMPVRWLALRRPALGLAVLLAGLAAATPAHAASSAADAARALAAAIERHDVDAVGAELTAGARARWADLLGASDRLAAARRRYREAARKAFGSEPPAAPDNPLRAWLDSIRKVEVRAQRPLSASAVEQDVRLLGDGPEPATSTWKAVREVGSWKIELPGSADPAQVSALKRRLEDRIAATEQAAREVASGKYRTAGEAQAALRPFERPRTSKPREE